MIYQPVPLQAPVLHVGAHYTFVGIFVEYQSECETMYRTKGWAESTKEQYDSIIRNVIYPHLDNHNYKPIADYTREDFDRAIQKITASGKKRGPSKDNQYDESTMAMVPWALNCRMEFSRSLLSVPGKTSRIHKSQKKRWKKNFLYRKLY